MKFQLGMVLDLLKWASPHPFHQISFFSTKESLCITNTLLIRDSLVQGGVGVLASLHSSLPRLFLSLNVAELLLLISMEFGIQIIFNFYLVDSIAPLIINPHIPPFLFGGGGGQWTSCCPPPACMSICLATFCPVNVLISCSPSPLQDGCFQKMFMLELAFPFLLMGIDSH